MSNIKTSPNRPLTDCGSKRDADGPLSVMAGTTNEASPPVSSSVTVTAADHSPHSRLSILPKCVEIVSVGLTFVTGASSILVRLINDHRIDPVSRSDMRLRVKFPDLQQLIRKGISYTYYSIDNAGKCFCEEALQASSNVP